MMVTPTELTLRRADRVLDVAFEDGSRFALPAEYLRVESPSAEVQGHAPEERRTVPGKRQVGITAIEPVGHYAVRLRFTDGHDTGLYTWEKLHALGQEQPARWASYLAALRLEGLSRDP